MIELEGVRIFEDVHTNPVESAGIIEGGPCGTIRIGRQSSVAVLGPNAAGKSTLLRAVCGLGRLAGGSVRIDGVCMADSRSCATQRGDANAPIVGYVSQDPDSQLVETTVLREAAFGPCNLALARDVVLERAQRALAACRLEEFSQLEVSSLSGGQRQRLALAGALAMEPQYFVMDEPCSMLDRPSRLAVLDIVEDMRVRGSCVLHATHDLDDVDGYDLVLVVDGGAIVWFGGMEEFLSSPHLMERAACRRRKVFGGHAPIDVQDAPDTGGYSVRAVGATYTYRGEGRGAAVAEVDVEVAPATLTLLAGRNGSGKTTLLRMLAGLVAPDEGSVEAYGCPVVAGDVGLVFQNAADQLFATTVLEDVAFGPRNLGMKRAHARQVAVRALAEAGLDPEALGQRSPQALSGGQARLVAIAGVLAMDARVVLFDEPTAGLDCRALDTLLGLLVSLRDRGTGVVVATHDLAQLYDTADRLVVMDGGRVRYDGPADDQGWSCLQDAGLVPLHDSSGAFSSTGVPA